MQSDRTLVFTRYHEINVRRSLYWKRNSYTFSKRKFWMATDGHSNFSEALIAGDTYGHLLMNLRNQNRNKEVGIGNTNTLKKEERIELSEILKQRVPLVTYILSIKNNS